MPGISLVSWLVNVLFHRNKFTLQKYRSKYSVMIMVSIYKKKKKKKKKGYKCMIIDCY